MSLVIKAENISKQYKLGAVGISNLTDDVQRLIAKIRGKEDPFLKVGEENNRSQAIGQGDSQYVWALRNIDFEINQGEVVAFIGKNGAGKSTLLKILSRVTEPTTGKLKFKGRISSLLEVGTGFHPELSGRDNIFLNGAILGMNRREIKNKFDEIVDFSGVERYIDTPVKRYSSGMYVRLAFAVAAHLEPDILVVDEVLAVGDIEFQKKCLGKMKDVSGQGRTVLFVSHNMAAVKSLCKRGILLEHGTIKMTGRVDEVVSHYFGGENSVKNYKEFHTNPLEAKGFKINSVGVRAKGKDFSEPVLRDESIEFVFDYTNFNTDNAHFDFTIKLKGEDGEYVLVTSTGHYSESVIKAGRHTLTMTVPPRFFNEVSFYVDFLLVMNKSEVPIMENDIISFSVNPENRDLGSWMGREVGYIMPSFEWR